MKNGFLRTAILSMSMLFMTSVLTAQMVNTAKSNVNWTGYKVTGQHTGTIAVKSGNLEFKDGMLSGGEFVIDMGSLDVTDLEGEYKQKLVGHLSSDDFFGVAKHPTASFSITNVISRGTPGDYKIVGDLTIKDITKEVKFIANVKELGEGHMATADITIDRSDFDIRYGSGSFFDNLGDKTIYDEFELKIALQTGK